MDRARYRQNATWLRYIAPFNGLTLSAAYLTPFFLEKGLSLSGILALQSIYSFAVVALEIPGGVIADRFGRVTCIRLSLLLSSLTIMAYALGDSYLYFVICEVLLALAKSLLSGVDDALLADSIIAGNSGEGFDKAEFERQYTRAGQRIDAFGYLGIAFGVPVSILVVSKLGISATLLIDGMLALAGVALAWKLVEAPRSNGSEKTKRKAVFHAAGRLLGNAEARWLVLLGAVLATATYLAFWLSAPYYEGLGISAVWFGAIMALRSGFKALLALCIRQERHLERNMFVYAGLAGLVYCTMASGQIWLLPLVLGHDVVQALQKRPVQAALNAHMHADHRATLKSLVSLAERAMIFAASLMAAAVIAGYGLSASMVIMGIAGSALALLALARLHAHRTFH